MQSGVHNVEWMQNVMRRNGYELDQRWTIIELGCGVGRITVPLSKLVSRIIGVDVSAGNLKECAGVLNAAGVDNVEITNVTRFDQFDALPMVDGLFTVIVLQHNPPPVIDHLLNVLLAKVRPGGFAYFQVPTHIKGYSFESETYLACGSQTLEMHALPMARIFEVLADHGFIVKEVFEDSSIGHPVSKTFFAVKG